MVESKLTDLFAFFFFDLGLGALITDILRNPCSHSATARAIARRPWSPFAPAVARLALARFALSQLTSFNLSIFKENKEDSPATAFFVVLVRAFGTGTFSVPGHLSKSIALGVALAEFAPLRCDAHNRLFGAGLCEDLWRSIRVRVAWVLSLLFSVT